MFLVMLKNFSRKCLSMSVVGSWRYVLNYLNWRVTQEPEGAQHLLILFGLREWCRGGREYARRTMHIMMLQMIVEGCAKYFGNIL